MSRAWDRATDVCCADWPAFQALHRWTKILRQLKAGSLLASRSLECNVLTGCVVHNSCLLCQVADPVARALPPDILRACCSTARS